MTWSTQDNLQTLWDFRGEKSTTLVDTVKVKAHSKRIATVHNFHLSTSRSRVKMHLYTSKK